MSAPPARQESYLEVIILPSVVTRTDDSTEKVVTFDGFSGTLGALKVDLNKKLEGAPKKITAKDHLSSSSDQLLDDSDQAPDHLILKSEVPSFNLPNALKLVIENEKFQGFLPSQWVIDNVPVFDFKAEDVGGFALDSILKTWDGLGYNETQPIENGYLSVVFQELGDDQYRMAIWPSMSDHIYNTASFPEGSKEQYLKENLLVSQTGGHNQLAMLLLHNADAIEGSFLAGGIVLEDREYSHFTYRSNVNLPMFGGQGPDRELADESLERFSDLVNFVVDGEPLPKS